MFNSYHILNQFKFYEFSHTSANIKAVIPPPAQLWPGLPHPGTTDTDQVTISHLSSPTLAHPQATFNSS